MNLSGNTLALSGRSSAPPFPASHQKNLSEPTPDHRLPPLWVLLAFSTPSEPPSPPPPLGWSEVQICLSVLVMETPHSPQATSQPVPCPWLGPTSPTILNENFRPNLWFRTFSHFNLPEFRGTHKCFRVNEKTVSLLPDSCSRMGKPLS